MEKIPLQQTKAWQKLQHDLNQTTFFLSDQQCDTSSSDQNHYTTAIPNQNHCATISPEKTSGNTFSTPVNYQMLIIKKSTPLGPYFYLPYGPYLRQKTAAKTAYEALKRLEKREDVIFTRIEPQSAKNASYWLKNAEKSKDLNPKETWVLNLEPPLETIYQNMKQNTRNLAKNYSRKGLTVEKYVAASPSEKSPDSPVSAAVDRSGEKLKILTNFLTKVAQGRHFNPIEESTLKAEFNQPFASLFIAYYTPKKYPEETAESPATTNNSQKIPIAAALFFDDDDTRYYMQSGSDENYHKLPGTLAIIAEAIKDAKAKNLKNFDFWGIAPETAPKNHPWTGFTKFKKSFGGEEIHYTGTYDLVRKPLKYQLYKLLRKINYLLRRI